MSLTLRIPKGSRLTFQEMDDNLTFLNKGYINYFDFESNLTTIIAESDEWYKLTTNTVSGFHRKFTDVGDDNVNRVVNNIGYTARFKLEAISSLQAGNNQQIHMAFFKNDTLLPCTEQSINTGTGNRITALPIQCVTELEPDDYVEVWVKNFTSASNVTLDNINVIVTEL